MPDDYYVSQYSGEEIDALLGSAGTGAVRYDAAQTLTDAQKTQARNNIGSAPSRFGLGENMTTGPLMQSLTQEALDTTYNNGWYFANDVNIAGFSQATIRVDSSGRTIYQTAYVAIADGYVLRRCLVDTVGSPSQTSFGPWEWVDPPMRLGVEYRTTERYLGKPVYAQLFSVGACSAGSEVNLYKGVGTLNTDKVVSYCGYAADRALSYFVKDTTYNIMLAVQKVEGTYDLAIGLVTGTSVSFTESYVIVKYTKTTD